MKNFEFWRWPEKKGAAQGVVSIKIHRFLDWETMQGDRWQAGLGNKAASKSGWRSVGIGQGGMGGQEPMSEKGKGRSGIRKGLSLAAEGSRRGRRWVGAGMQRVG